MAAVDLTKYGITGATEIIHNPSYEVLFEGSFITLLTKCSSKKKTSRS